MRSKEWRVNHTILRELSTHFLTKNTHKKTEVQGVKAHVFLVDLWENPALFHWFPLALTWHTTPCRVGETTSPDYWPITLSQSTMATCVDQRMSFYYKSATSDSPPVWCLCQVDETIRLHTRWWNGVSSLFRSEKMNDPSAHGSNGPKLSYRSTRSAPTSWICGLETWFCSHVRVRHSRRKFNRL